MNEKILTQRRDEYLEKFWKKFRSHGETPITLTADEVWDAFETGYKIGHGDGFVEATTKTTAVKEGN